MNITLLLNDLSTIHELLESGEVDEAGELLEYVISELVLWKGE